MSQATAVIPAAGFLKAASIGHGLLKLESRPAVSLAAFFVAYGAPIVDIRTIRISLVAWGAAALKPKVATASATPTNWVVHSPTVLFIVIVDALPLPGNTTFASRVPGRCWQADLNGHHHQKCKYQYSLVHRG